MQNKNIMRIVLATAAILLVPFLGGAPWDETDYIVAAGLLLGSGFTFEFVARKFGHTAYRFAVGIAVVAALLLVWINLAVGFIGSEDNPANLLYGGVLAVGLIGAILARLRPLGMARTLFAMAVTQALVPVIALILWQPPFTTGLVRVFIFNTIFALLFVGSGLLFRHANATRLKSKQSVE